MLARPARNSSTAPKGGRRRWTATHMRSAFLPPSLRPPPELVALSTHSARRRAGDAIARFYSSDSPDGLFRPGDTDAAASQLMLGSLDRAWRPGPLKRARGPSPSPSYLSPSPPSRAARARARTACYTSCTWPSGTSWASPCATPSTRPSRRPHTASHPRSQIASALAALCSSRSQASRNARSWAATARSRDATLTCAQPPRPSPRASPLRSPSSSTPRRRRLSLAIKLAITSSSTWRGLITSALSSSPAPSRS